MSSALLFEFFGFVDPPDAVSGLQNAMDKDGH
jgi:hypothetical protein